MDSDSEEFDIKPDISMLEPTAEVTISEGFVIKSEIDQDPNNEPIDINSEIEDPLNQMHKTTKVECDYCSETFEAKNDFKMHMKCFHEELVEEMQREHLCEICNKSFKSEVNLKFHFQNVHVNKETDETCEICNETFINSDILKRHIRIVHYEAKCEFCNKNFSTQGNLKFHINSIHEGLKNHICETCGKGFSRQHHLRQHIVNVHKGIIDFTATIIYTVTDKKTGPLLYLIYLI